MTYNATKLQNMLAQTRRWNNRIALRHMKTRLNCPSGCGVRRVTDFKPLAGVVVLDCGHVRGVQTEMTEAERQELVAFAATQERDGSNTLALPNGQGEQ